VRPIRTTLALLPLLLAAAATAALAAPRSVLVEKFGYPS
jgi:hypothetical protein